MRVNPRAPNVFNIKRVAAQRDHWEEVKFVVRPSGGKASRTRARIHLQFNAGIRREIAAACSRSIFYRLKAELRTRHIFLTIRAIHRSVKHSASVIRLKPSFSYTP